MLTEKDINYSVEYDPHSGSYTIIGYYSAQESIRITNGHKGKRTEPKQAIKDAIVLVKTKIINHINS